MAKHVYKTGMIIAAIGAALFVSALASVSLELAGMVCVLGALVYFGLQENMKRTKWQRRSDKQITALRNGLGKLHREVTRNTRDISGLKDNMRTAAAEIKSQSRKLDSFAPSGGKAYRELAGHMEEWSYRPRSPALDDADPAGTFTPRGSFPLSPKPKAPIASTQTTEPGSLSDVVVKELLNVAMRNKRVDLFMQPVVRLPQRQMRAFEMFARIRAKAGLYVPANQYMPVARKKSMATDIDSLLLDECLRLLKKSAHLERGAPFFVNIENRTLTDVGYMTNLLGFLKTNRKLAGRLIFDIRQSDFDALQPRVRQILRGITTLGCGLCLDHTEHLDIEVADLNHAGVRYVKIPAGVFLTKSRSARESAALMRLKSKLEGNGIGVIATRIESETVLRSLYDFNLNYGQGYLFGKPDLKGVYQSRKQPPSVKRRAA